MIKKDWYKLDKAALIYPASENKLNADNFRISVVLKELVKPEQLAWAANKAISHFPSMQVTMRNGLFWKYFDVNHLPILVYEESERPCSKIDMEANNGYLFKIIFYRNRISLEMFHAVTDGTGALAFLKKLIEYYYDDVTKENQEARIKEEDSYLKNYSRDDVYELPSVKLARKIKGESIGVSGSNVTQGIVPVKDVLSIARENGLTITQFLTGVFVRAIAKTESLGQSRKPITVLVPVNLRKFYPSNSLRNFTYFLRISMTNSMLVNKETTFEQVRMQMNKGLEKEQLYAPIHYNIRLSESIFFKLLPYGVKHHVMKIARGVYNDLTMTTMLTNLGKIDLKDSLKNKVLGFDFILGSASKNALNMAVCSYGDSLVISISRNIVENDVVENFFMLLEKEYKLSVRRFSNE